MRQAICYSDRMRTAGFRIQLQQGPNNIASIALTPPSGVVDDNGQHQSYQWQGNRLSQASTVLGNYSYQYDAVDNRTARTVTERDGRTSSEWYDYPLAGSGNRLLSSEDDAIAQATVYKYNGAGSTTQRGDLSFTYDAHQHPVQVRHFDRLIAEYVYNPFGERVKKTVYEAQGPPTITYFLFDGSSLSAQVDAEGELIDQYVYLEDYRPIARLSGGDIQAIHTDHLGAPRLVTDSEAKVIWQARYSPSGAATVEIAQIDLPHRLPGQQLDAETGLHYNYFRHYDPSTGSYTTSDPLGLVAGYNTYGYVGANPLSAIDPRGLIGFPLIGGGGGLLSLGRGVFFLDTASATGALARFVAGVVAVGASPVVVGGTVVAVAALAAYYATHNNNNEDAFVQDLGGAKPERADFYALRDQIKRFAPEGYQQFDWESEYTWNRFFWLQSKLLEAQRDYIADCNDSGNIGTELYNEASAADTAATEAEQAAEDVDTATPPPDCDELGRQIREALYDNKQDRPSEGGRFLGGHGYLRRMLEQICGAHGPGTNSWRNHRQQLVGERNNANDAIDELNDEENSCTVSDHTTRRDRQLLGLINEREGWQPNSIKWIGRDDHRCADWESIAHGDDNQELIRKLLELAGGSI